MLFFVEYLDSFLFWATLCFIIFCTVFTIKGIVIFIKKFKSSTSSYMSDYKKIASEFSVYEAFFALCHVSGLPIAENVSINVFDCDDCIVISNNVDVFKLYKSKISRADFVETEETYTIIIYYNSDGVNKTISIKDDDDKDLEKLKKIIDKDCNSSLGTVEL